MSTRVLCSQTSTGVTPSCLPVTVQVECHQTSLPGNAPEIQTKDATCLYNNVVALRLAFPVKESGHNDPVVGQDSQVKKVQLKTKYQGQ